MSEANRREDEMLPEYDFTGAERDRYRRLAESAEAWVPGLAAADAHGWVVRTLVELQKVESQLVAYRSIALNEALPMAGGRVSTMLEDTTGAALESFWSHYAAVPGATAELRASLLDLLRERNWLVHRSFKELEDVESPQLAAALAERLSGIWSQAGRIAAGLADALEQACVQRGMDRGEVKSRAAEVVERWLRGRPAA
ncbi:MAG: hypothetical protein ACRELD_11845 [Longimicrobiales bacterium]